MTCGVPQGLILGPQLFNLYMLPLGQIVHDNNAAYHSYTDNTQIYLALPVVSVRASKQLDAVQFPSIK